MVLRKSFYIRWSAGRSPRVHEVNPGRDPSQDRRNFGHKSVVWVSSKVGRMQGETIHKRTQGLLCVLLKMYMQ